MVSTLPGPHDYRSAGIAPALDHVGAGVLEECQPIRVEYRGLDRLLVGTPHWITGPLELPPSGLPEGPTLSTGGNITTNTSASDRRRIRRCATVPSHKPRPGPFFFSRGTKIYPPEK